MNAGKKPVKTVGGRLFFDGECGLCTGAAMRFTPLLHRYHFELAPLQGVIGSQRLGLKTGEPLAEMKLLARDGRVFGGADAILEIARNIWWARPLCMFAFIPGVKGLFRRLYRWVAVNRHCSAGVCSFEKSFPHRHATFFEMP
jgi:predicted DCC family thiol-disulfide oxidoreductase YuxK